MAKTVIEISDTLSKCPADIFSTILQQLVNNETTKAKALSAIFSAMNWTSLGEQSNISAYINLFNGLSVSDDMAIANNTEIYMSSGNNAGTVYKIFVTEK
ncbi:MAG: hypothetical protein GY845_21470 [Planctomycetes bacterium]|nr:hypothetical protein [Planctomycetota bacterium]